MTLMEFLLVWLRTGLVFSERVLLSFTNSSQVGIVHIGSNCILSLFFIGIYF